MTRHTSFIAIVVACLIGFISAECPNACSAHGKCGAYDMCICYRNWMSNDCSERICQFGLAHVDSPKGDLDASSGALSGPDVTVVKNDAMYPYGTTEQYPSVEDSDGNTVSNTAHEYRECSNKGICDRATGTCGCFEGYSGSACQRASCPSSSSGVCSGHGTCQSISQIAAADNGNIYKLWDEDSTMGCVCDPGYSGPDCSERECKYGADPLYYDDFANIRYSNWTYQIYTKSATSLSGNYSIIFYDVHGEDWETEPIAITANCDVVTSALEGLPNNVIPEGSVKCFNNDFYNPTGGWNGQNASENSTIYDPNMYIRAKFTIAFPSNVGYLKQPTINRYLDGTRPTLFSSEASSTVGYHIFANGFHGEWTDYVPDYCAGVKVQIDKSGAQFHKLSGLDAAEIKLLKACLGDSNGDSSDNVEVYNWDYGNKNAYENPHLIKLIDATQNALDPDTTATQEGCTTRIPSDIFPGLYEDPALIPYPKTRLCSSREDLIPGYGKSWCSNKNPPGFFAILFFDGTNFNIFTRAGADYSSDTEFFVFTTTGYLQKVSQYANAATHFAANSDSASIDLYHSQVVYTTNITNNGTTYFGQVDCESASTYNYDCLSKGDRVFLVNTKGNAAALQSNPRYPNLYTVTKIGREPKTSHYTSEKYRHQIKLDFGVNTKYEYTGRTNSDTTASIYKFYPPTGYNYVGECSNRGLCDSTTGTCTCFPGYTTDNCGTQNALAA